MATAISSPTGARREPGRDPDGRAARASRIDATRRRSCAYATFGALIALIVFNLVFTRHFLSMQTLDVNLTQVASIVIVGVGMTLVIATGGIDLSVGSLMAIAGALAPIIFLGKVVNIGEIHVAVAVAMIVSILSPARSAGSTAG